MDSRTSIQHASSAQRRILIVDDAEDGREYLAEYLKVQGHVVCTAQDGIEGLDVATTFRPDIIFLDLRMPRMDGFELCSRLRACDLTKDSAVFALTARLDHGRSMDRNLASFDACLLKPIETDVIDGLVRCARITST